MKDTFLPLALNETSRLTLSRLRNVTLFIRAISSAKYMSGFIILSEQERIAMGPRVFVDAKILRRHEKTAPKNTIVGYVVEGENLSGFNRVRADETDEAELEAVYFAITRLKGRFSELTIVTDHESVFSLIKGKKRKAGERRPILLKILDEIEVRSGISMELLEKNPAHKALNKHLREHPEIDSETKP